MKRLVTGSIAVGALALGGCNDTTLAYMPAGTDAPIAVIQSSATSFNPLDTATFDGTASHDPDGGDIQHYTWEITQRPTGSTAQVVALDTIGSQGDFFVDFAGDYTVKLTVTDDEGMTGSTEMHFSAVPWQALHVELAWDTDYSDVDLHLVDETGGGTYYIAPGDCFYANKSPNWGTTSTADNPSLDIDDVNGFGPENINLAAPQDGHTYHVYVHYYDEHGAGPTTATVKMYLSGTQQFEKSILLPHTGSIWNVGTVQWASGDIHDIGTVN